MLREPSSSELRRIARTALIRRCAFCASVTRHHPQSVYFRIVDDADVPSEAPCRVGSPVFFWCWWWVLCGLWGYGAGV